MLKIMLIGYIFLFIHRPFEVWPVLGTFRIERVYMLATIAVVLASNTRHWPSNPLHLAFGAFTLALLVSSIVSPWTDLCEVSVEEYLKLLVFYVLLVMSINSREELRTIVFSFLVVMFLYMSHSLREYHNGRHTFKMGICRMIAVDATLNDPNSFGNSIVYALPFVIPFWCDRPSWTRRIFLAGYVVLSGLCIVLTGSRSSLLGSLLLLGIVSLRSRKRWRNIVLIGTLLPFLWILLPEGLQNRFESLVDPDAAGASARDSAESRSAGFWLGLKLLQTYPLTGCGPGAWQPASGSHVESHNLYGQVLGETGILGILAFLALLVALWWNVRWILRTYRNRPEWDHDFLYFLARATCYSYIIMLFLGWGSHNMIRYNWLWYGGFVLIARECVRRRDEEESDQSDGPDEVMGEDSEAEPAVYIQQLVDTIETGSLI